MTNFALTFSISSFIHSQREQSLRRQVLSTGEISSISLCNITTIFTEKSLILTLPVLISWLESLSGPQQIKDVISILHKNDLDSQLVATRVNEFNSCLASILYHCSRLKNRVNGRKLTSTFKSNIALFLCAFNILVYKAVSSIQ